MKKSTKPKPPRDASRPLPKKRELFCKLYAYEHWGDPAEAARSSGFSTEPEKLRKLLTEPDIIARIHCLRQQISDQTIADEAWIKRCFIDIIRNADKPADKLRALATLYRTLSGQKKAFSEHGGEIPSFEFDLEDEI